MTTRASRGKGEEASVQLEGRVSEADAQSPTLGTLTGGLGACGSQAWDARWKHPP